MLLKYENIFEDLFFENWTNVAIKLVARLCVALFAKICGLVLRRLSEVEMFFKFKVSFQKVQKKTSSFRLILWLLCTVAV